MDRPSRPPFGRGLTYVKDDLFEVPPLFEFIRNSGGDPIPWRQMYQVFNMGSRMEFFVDAAIADRIIEISEEFAIEAKVIGHVEKSEDGLNHLHSMEP
ncbi:MAG: hypothetical protein U5N86_01965 [Planctomycetota bacterium]|nr:hypothetical protein [Planctomycetota bacterium]